MPGKRQDLRLALQRLAFSQSGFFTAAQAIELGYTYQAQKYHVDHGNWLRIDRAIFRLPDWPAASEDTYVRWSLWSGGRATISDESALVIHDLGDLDPRRTHLTVPLDFGAKDEAVVLHHRELESGEIEARSGFRVTTPIRTLLDLAAGDASQESVDVAVSEAIERGVVTQHQLRSRADDAGDRAALRIERALGSVST